MENKISGLNASMCAIVIGLSSITLTANAQQSEAFSMRGVVLGVSLDEFKAMQPALVEDGYESAGTKCDQKYGATTKCRWEAKSQYSSLVSSQPVRVGNTGVYPVFVFSDAIDGTDRLMQIDVGSNMRYWSELEKAFIERFGKPERTSLPVQNRLGASFEKDVLVWRNATSSITLESRCPVIDQVCITYTHAAIAAANETKAKDALGPPKF